MGFRFKVKGMVLRCGFRARGSTLRLRVRFCVTAVMFELRFRVYYSGLKLLSFGFSVSVLRTEV